MQVSGKKILGKSENALEISNQCNRILACCIIYYNASLLSELLVQSEMAGNAELVRQIKDGHPLLGSILACMEILFFPQAMNFLI